MPDPRKLAEDAEKRVKDDDVVKKIDPTKPHKQDDSGPHGPPPPPPPSPGIGDG